MHTAFQAFSAKTLLGIAQRGQTFQEFSSNWKGLSNSKMWQLKKAEVEGDVVANGIESEQKNER